MAVMDTLEARSGDQSVKKGMHSSQQHQDSAVHPAHPTSAESAKVSVKKENVDASNAPIPEKGSGQDRFRQMLAGVPCHVDPAASSALRPVTANSKNAASFQIYAGHVDVPSAPGFNPTFTAPSFPLNIVPQSMQPPILQPPSWSIPYPSRAILPTGSTNREKSGRDWAHDRYNGAPEMDGRASTLGAGSPPWTSVLSSECQKRRFNPQFKEWITNDGAYQCSVELNGRTMHDSRSWSTPAEAKQALARRAVDYIRTTPVPSGHSANAREKAKNQAPHMDDRSNRTTLRTEQEEERRLLARIRSLYGPSAGPSDGIMRDPAASRAFLEGFLLGSKLRESSRDQRRRSRSPFRGGGGGGGPGRRGSFDGYAKRE